MKHTESAKALSQGGHRRWLAGVLMRWGLGLGLLCGGALAGAQQDATPAPARPDLSQNPGQQSLLRVPSAREVAQVLVDLHRMPGARATLVMLPGGRGGIGRAALGRWPDGENFLVRSAPLFAAQGFHVALVARPSDQEDMDYPFRVSPAHVDDLRRVLRQLRETVPGPLWLVGTSRGTVSATAAGIALREEGLIDGIVLTSSVTQFRVTGAVPKQALDQIRVPVLVVHHEQDACSVCRPQEAPLIVQGLKNSRLRELVYAQGGGPATGNPCEALHYHGFIGIEAQVAQRISDWIWKAGG